MLTLLLVLALLLPGIWLIRVLFTTKLLLGLELRPETVSACRPEQIPPHLREAARPWIAQLEALGFQVLGGLHVGRSMDGALDGDLVVLVHPQIPVRAHIQPHESASRSGECWLSLRTTTAAGHEIATHAVAQEEIMPLPPGFEREVIETDVANELLQRHRARIAAEEAGAWRCADIEHAALRERYVSDGIYAHLGGSGLVAERAGGCVSFRAVPAFGRAVQLAREAARRKKLERKPVRPPMPGTAPLSVRSLEEFDYGHYRQIGAVMRGRLSLRAKAVISVVSFVLFAIVLGWQTSPVVAASLLVALVVHEGGHLLGMKIFGFRDTQLLFIPFFGGAAVGHDEKVLRPWQHIVIILLGPLPGLFLGLGVMALATGGTAPEWLQEAALTTVVLNAFNLLPIIPLDGGQIVDFAVASRFPRARVFFLGASALGLLLVALVFSGVKLLIGLAIATLLRLPLEWKQAGLRRELREEFPDGSPEEEPVVRRLLVRLRDAEWAKVSMVQRLQIARALQSTLRTPRAGWGTLCFAVAGYTAPLWGGVPLALWAAYRKGEVVVQRAEDKVRAAGLDLGQRAATPAVAVPAEENAAVLVAEAEALLEREPGQRASEAESEKVVELLRAAARRRVFVPLPVAGKDAKPLWAAEYARGAMVQHLTDAAQERLRYREPAEAVAIAMDALRLARLMDGAEGWWRWDAHETAVKSGWATIEEALASGAKLPAGTLRRLQALIDEEHEIQFAASAMPQDLLRDARLYDRMGADESQAARVRIGIALASVVFGGAEHRAETLHEALALHEYLQAIRKGRWPEDLLRAPAGNEDETRVAATQVAQLADLIARLRQARAALLVAEQRERGVSVKSLEHLGAKSGGWQHPFTGEPMRWVRRGSVDVLAFATGLGRVTGQSGSDETLVWRLPAH